MIIFAYPLIFLLLLLPFIYRALAPIVKGMYGDALEVPQTFMNAISGISTKSGSKFATSVSGKTTNLLKLALLYLVWVLLVCTVARPQLVGEPIPLRTYSREILLVIDISNSMLEPDFNIEGRRVDRLTAVKKAASNFIRNRADDKVGLILFATNAYLQAPMTYDKKSVEKILWSADAGMAGSSTAIGDALGLALKTLRKGENLDKKVIILLSDGENNDGSLNIAEAVNLAKKEGIKTYTIGVGTEGSLVQSMFGFNIKMGSNGFNDKELKQIAEATQGSYFKASDTEGLQKIYQTIDKLEPTENQDIYIQEVQELYYFPLIFALFLAGGLILWSRRLSI